MPEKRKVVLLEGSDGKNLDDVYEQLVKEAAIEESTYALPRGYLSWSQVGSYMRCPKAYEWRYIKGIISPPPARMAEGSAIHKGLEAGHREQKKTHKVPPLDVFLDAWHMKWKNVSKEIKDWEGETSRIVEVRDKTFLTDYRATRVPVLRPVGVEERFYSMLGKIPVLGFIDLIDHEKSGKTVVDVKVVSRTKSEADVNSDGQLTLYSCVTGVEQVRFDCFVKLKKAPVIKTISSTRTATDHVWIERVFDGVAKAISTGIFPPCDPSSWICSEKWCGFWDICRGA